MLLTKQIIIIILIRHKMWDKNLAVNQMPCLLNIRFLKKVMDG